MEKVSSAVIAHDSFPARRVHLGAYLLPNSKGTAAHPAVVGDEAGYRAFRIQNLKCAVQVADNPLVAYLAPRFGVEWSLGQNERRLQWRAHALHRLLIHQKREDL